MLSQHFKADLSSFAQTWQRITVALEFAVQSIWSARRRMWLVVLGAAIGFGAIDSMLIIGTSMQERIQASLDSLGGDILTLDVNGGAQDGSLDRFMGRRPSLNRALPAVDGTGLTFDVETLTDLMKSMNHVESIAWVQQAKSCASIADDLTGLQLMQAPFNVQQLLSLKLSQGRFLHPGDTDQPNILLGSTAMEALRSQKPGTGVGSLVQSCGRTYRVVGVLMPHPGSDFVQALQINESALLLSQSLDVDTAESTKSLLVRLRKGTEAQVFAKQLVERLQLLLPGYTVDATGAWEFIKSRQEQASLYARFLAVLGSVSLLVGALGIANMMLVTVNERRAEIGLRMAIGAKRSDIVMQFLLEGILICIVGSAIGLLLGWGVAYIALNLGGFATALTASVILKASLLAIACGILSGAYPAHRAATIEPVNSLQG